MRIALESAALVVDKSWHVEPKPETHIADLKSADLLGARVGGAGGGCENVKMVQPNAQVFLKM